MPAAFTHQRAKPEQCPRDLSTKENFTTLACHEQLFAFSDFLHAHGVFLYFILS